MHPPSLSSIHLLSRFIIVNFQLHPELCCASRLLIRSSSHLFPFEEEQEDVDEDGGLQNKDLLLQQFYVAAYAGGRSLEEEIHVKEDKDELPRFLVAL